jgi:hypothetical protein
MTAAEAHELEEAIAAVIVAERQRFAAELEPLRRRLDAVEKDLATERRLADVEARVAGAGGTVAANNVARLARGGR